MVWRNKCLRTVKDLIEIIKTSQQLHGYLDPDVWETLRKFVNPYLLPSAASFVNSAETSDSPLKKTTRENKKGK